VNPAPKSNRLAWLRPLFAAAMLAIVAYNVPWRDRLSWKGPSGSADVAGTIVGDWRNSRIAFEVAPGETIDADWPASVARQLAEKGPVALNRDTFADDPAIAAGTLAWRPGMLRAFREMDKGGVWIALGFLMLGALVSITRWWRLLAVAGCPARWTSTLRLTFLGFFFNLVVPGLTGGDVIKAVLVVRENPERRADALMSVVVDRVLGLIALMGLATAVVQFSGDRFIELRWYVTLTFAAMVGGLWVVLHDLPRRILRFDALLARLPMKEQVQNLDRAVRMYVTHPVELTFALALSAANHLSVAAGVCALGRAFGDSLKYVDYVGVTSIANAVSALPVAPAGWGVGEAAFGYIFGLLGAAPTLGVAVSVTYRLLMMGIGLLGGLFMLLPGGRDVRREALEDVNRSTEAAARG
jgi:uncharacterized protein (TIRG00374 family)